MVPQQDSTMRTDFWVPMISFLNASNFGEKMPIYIIPQNWRLIFILTVTRRKKLLRRRPRSNRRTMKRRRLQHLLFVVVNRRRIDIVKLTVHFQRLLVPIVHENTYRQGSFLHLIFRLHSMLANLWPHKKSVSILYCQFLAYLSWWTFKWGFLYFYLVQIQYSFLIRLQLIVVLSLEIVKQLQIKPVEIKLKRREH